MWRAEHLERAWKILGLGVVGGFELPPKSNENGLAVRHKSAAEAPGLGGLGLWRSWEGPWRLGHWEAQEGPSKVGGLRV